MARSFMSAMAGVGVGAELGLNTGADNSILVSHMGSRTQLPEPLPPTLKAHIGRKLESGTEHRVITARPHCLPPGIFLKLEFSIRVLGLNWVRDLSK